MITSFIQNLYDAGSAKDIENVVEVVRDKITDAMMEWLN